MEWKGMSSGRICSKGSFRKASLFHFNISKFNRSLESLWNMETMTGCKLFYMGKSGSILAILAIFIA